MVNDLPKVDSKWLYLVTDASNDKIKSAINNWFMYIIPVRLRILAFGRLCNSLLAASEHSLARLSYS